MAHLSCGPLPGCSQRGPPRPGTHDLTSWGPSNSQSLGEKEVSWGLIHDSLRKSPFCHSCVKTHTKFGTLQQLQRCWRGCIGVAGTSTAAGVAGAERTALVSSASGFGHISKRLPWRFSKVPQMLNFGWKEPERRARDGLPYCEADYHAKFGIRCDSCEKYITGRVLELSHWTPSAAVQGLPSTTFSRKPALFTEPPNPAAHPLQVHRAPHLAAHPLDSQTPPTTLQPLLGSVLSAGHADSRGPDGSREGARPCPELCSLWRALPPIRIGGRKFATSGESSPDSPGLCSLLDNSLVFCLTKRRQPDLSKDGLEAHSTRPHFHPYWLPCPAASCPPPPPPHPCLGPAPLAIHPSTVLDPVFSHLPHFTFQGFLPSGVSDSVRLLH
ncbi:hypothetical protein P7K49_006030 [Saguinus oedipus]|uniref:Uncharacterized protein n=1 Tax=Saguinus oedipus TaxID=9490 RepID=A0ABQ9W2V6_SAGOE|nr:hypothetical protein P7K49_006030 [Saguinus oedipus]